jgi:type IV pilus biogenesis protein CpaD/CtpE
LRVLFFIVALLAGCAHEPVKTDFYVGALVNQAWFVLRDHPEQRALVVAQPKAPLTGEMWREFNLALATVPAAERAACQEEVMFIVLGHAR